MGQFSDGLSEWVEGWENLKNASTSKEKFEFEKKIVEGFDKMKSHVLAEKPFDDEDTALINVIDDIEKEYGDVDPDSVPGLLKRLRDVMKYYKNGK
jgi:hypothetical protein